MPFQNLSGEWCCSRSFCRSRSLEFSRQYHIRTDDDHFNFGWEMGRIARSIVVGQGFSSPYEGNTGPTAWEPPLYPFLIAGVFRVFGFTRLPRRGYSLLSTASSRQLLPFLFS